MILRRSNRISRGEKYEHGNDSDCKTRYLSRSAWLACFLLLLISDDGAPREGRSLHGCILLSVIVPLPTVTDFGR